MSNFLEDPLSSELLSLNLDSSFESFLLGSKEEKDGFAEYSNPISFINSKFPNEESLNGIEEVSKELQLQVQSLSGEISNSVWTNENYTATQNIEEAQTIMQDLFLKINDFNEKVTKSEINLNKVCETLSELETGKKNLNVSIDLLEDLKFFMTLLTNFKLIITKKSFRKATQTILKLVKILPKFKEDEDEKLIKNLLNRYNELSEQWISQIYQEFNTKLFGSETTKRDFVTLRQCCFNVDAFGEQTHNELVKWFCDLRLSKYINNFNPKKNNSQTYFQNLEKRSNWLKKQLMSYRSKFSLAFPDHWMIPMKLSEEFCKITRNHLDYILKIKNSELDSKIIISSLGIFKNLENFLTNLFYDENNNNEKKKERVKGKGKGKGKEGEKGKGKDKGKNNTFNKNEVLNKKDLLLQIDRKKLKTNENLSTAAFEIKQKYLKSKRERENREQKMNKKIEFTNSKTTNQTNLKKHTYLEIPKYEIVYPKWDGIITSVFEPYLKIYVKRESKRLYSAYQHICEEESFVINKNSSVKYLNSYSELFLIIKRSFAKTINFTKSISLYHLFLEYSNLLGNYSQFLFENLPQLPEISKKISFTLRSLQEEKKKKIFFTKEEYVQCVLIINTSEQCSNSSQQLEHSVKKTIDEKYQKQIDIDEAIQAFSDTINQSINTIIGSLLRHLSPYIKSISKTQWSAIKKVGDQSKFVFQIQKILNHNFLEISHYISLPYWKLLLNCFLHSFFKELHNQIYQCKKIHGNGANQLLMDVEVIKDVLISIPTLYKTKSNERLQVPKPYRNLTNKKFKAIEFLLKVISVKKEQFLTNYQLLANGNESLSEIKKFLGLTGFSRNSKLEIIEKLKKIISAKNTKKAMKK
ncbi:vacuolar protein sorting-associated protein [Anaeramoeba flamelloides]|uniref:Vacuolar protein sorting-associated protein n=1 Tax=Anaeramoeba flamelloides TaxID=1746091 RepID=A0ABQ8YMZ2_9EUKA|nr:vacuolar protein sorting-associated protein [Anaeramoeba flamelloides]